MAKDIPGFYYDPLKNRYFPIKGPIPGSSSSSFHNPTSQSPIQSSKKYKRKGIRTAKLLYVRELYGNLIPTCKGRYNFQEEYRNAQASQPMVWKYQGTEMVCDSAVEHVHVNINSPEGQIGMEALLTGSANGSLSLYKVEQHFDHEVNCMPESVWPIKMENQAECNKAPGPIWRSADGSLHLPSDISSIKVSGRHSLSMADDVSTARHALITTLGSEMLGGCVFLLNLTDPFDYNTVLRHRIKQAASVCCTIWSADYISSRSRAVIGTNLGAALVDLETGVTSWVSRSKSDVLSQQSDHSGNVILCGHRNGAILTVDVRQKQMGNSERLIRHRIPFSRKKDQPLGKSAQNYTKQWFEVKGYVCPSRTIFMPSSVSSLLSLQRYDQYFLASSMDGTMRLYDHRLIQRAPVQSYPGHVNSHRRIQLGVDPSERFVMSGGEDCAVRLWSIKSGELLFENKFMDAVPTTICWPSSEYDSSSRSWLGSQAGLFLMHWS